MTEADCCRIASDLIMERYPGADEVTWSGEFADLDGRRPDGLVLVRHSFLRALIAGPYFLHAIESKVDPRYFAGLFDDREVDAVTQALSYSGNANWLAVANATLNEDEWDELELLCREEGLGLVRCWSREGEILVEPAKLGGEPWNDYPRLLAEMDDLEWAYE